MAYKMMAEMQASSKKTCRPTLVRNNLRQHRQDKTGVLAARVERWLTGFATGSAAVLTLALFIAFCVGADIIDVRQILSPREPCIYRDFQ